MSRRGFALALLASLSLPLEVARAEGVNKLAVKQAEAALVVTSGALKLRLTLVTGQALDYEYTDPEKISLILRFIEISANGGFLSAEISTDFKTLRALHIGTVAPDDGRGDARRRPER